MNDATRARARTIAALLRSMRTKRGQYSIASRMKEGNLTSYAEHLATVYANNPPTEAELTRSLSLHAGKQPHCFNTPEEIARANRQRLSVQQTREHIIHDVSRSVVKCLSAVEKLDLCNGSGLPRRFKLQIYGGDDE